MAKGYGPMVPAAPWEGIDKLAPTRCGICGGGIATCRCFTRVALIVGWVGHRLPRRVKRWLTASTTGSTGPG